MSEKTIKDDLLRGAREISEFTGLEQRAILKIHKFPENPIKKIPGLGICASKTALRAYFGIDTEKETAA